MKIGGTGTGVGSLPGTDIVAAIAETFGELPELPYLPELPARGPGAEMIGRTASLLIELPVEVYAGRWRVAARSGADLRRAHDFLARDLDALTERAAGYSGPLKIQAAGPWTLAASLELALGSAVLSDHGAVRDLAASLREGLRAHVAAIRARVPGSEVVLQLDEPSLPAVLAGRVPTGSGLYTYRSVEQARARETLASIVDGAGAPVLLHCCAPDAPITLMREAGAAGLALDLSLVHQLDPLGEAIDAGLMLLAGVLPTSVAPLNEDAVSRGGAASRGGPASPDGGRDVSAQTLATTASDRVLRLWRDLGFPAEQLAQQVVLTPACGLAGASPAYARAVLKACRDAARQLTDA